MPHSSYSILQLIGKKYGVGHVLFFVCQTYPKYLHTETIEAYSQDVNFYD